MSNAQLRHILCRTPCVREFSIYSLTFFVLLSTFFLEAAFAQDRCRGTINGRVCEAGAICMPVEGIDLELRGARGVVGTTRSGRGGSFMFTELCEGNYIALSRNDRSGIVRSSGSFLYQAAGVQVRVAEPPAVRAPARVITLALHPVVGHVQVELQRADGTLAAVGTYELNVAAASGRRWTSRTSGGRASVDVICCGDYTVSARALARGPVRGTLEFPNQAVRLTVAQSRAHLTLQGKAPVQQGPAVQVGPRPEQPPAPQLGRRPSQGAFGRLMEATMRDPKCANCHNFEASLRNRPNNQPGTRGYHIAQGRITAQTDVGDPQNCRACHTAASGFADGWHAPKPGGFIHAAHDFQRISGRQLCQVARSAPVTGGDGRPTGVSLPYPIASAINVLQHYANDPLIRWAIENGAPPGDWQRFLSSHFVEWANDGCDPNRGPCFPCPD